uniref:(northern house mosquito) hypothetical protein n=1 Tax=Culex pipiens TaxID=7175 RepID=A0A8D8FNR8_CULPI
MILKHHMLRLHLNPLRYRDGKLELMEINQLRVIRRQHLNRYAFLPKCSIKCRICAVPQYGSIRLHSRYSNVPTVWSRRSRNRRFPSKSLPPTSARCPTHLVLRRHVAHCPDSRPTSPTIRTRRSPRVAKCHRCRVAVAARCPSRRARESSSSRLPWRAADSLHHVPTASNRPSRAQQTHRLASVQSSASDVQEKLALCSVKKIPRKTLRFRESIVTRPWAVRATLKSHASTPCIA